MNQNVDNLSIISAIIKDVYTAPSIDEMRYTFLKAIQVLIPFHAGIFLLEDTPEHKSHPVGVGAHQKNIDIYVSDFFNKDFCTWYIKSGKSMVFRKDDVFGTERIKESPLYSTLFEQNSINPGALLTCLALNGKFLGMISFVRYVDEPPFSDDDIAIMNIIKDHLETRLMLDRRIFIKNKRDITSTNKFENNEYLRNNLTYREYGIITMVLDGKTNTEIGKELFINVNTVKKHISNAYKKLGVNSRHELYAKVADSSN